MIREGREGLVVEARDLGGGDEFRPISSLCIAAGPGAVRFRRAGLRVRFAGGGHGCASR